MNKVVTITVDEDGSLVRASIAGLSLDAAHMVVKRADAEAIKLLESRAQHRRFRRPVTWSFFNSQGIVTMRTAE